MNTLSSSRYRDTIYVLFIKRELWAQKDETSG
jgi:hypothetical protein